MNNRVAFARARTTLAAGGCVLALLATFACGGSSPTAPTANNPVPRSLAPATGTTFGGTEVTITGERFVAGSTVTFGGTAATNIAVENGTTIRATTPAHASGTVDVVVSGSTGSGVLVQAFTFVSPTGSNTPPTIKSVTAKGRRANEPQAFADLGETIDLTAIVEDAETPIDRLTFQWTADSGTFSGSGPVVTWTAPPSASTPSDVTITLTVVETYKAPDPSGLPVDRENRVTATTKVGLHNSTKEVSDMAYDFLVAFSHSDIGPDQVLRDFTTSCSGTPSERDDIVKNRATRQIVDYSVGTPAVTINFGGTCPFRSRPGDACAQVPASWKSKVIVHTGPPDYAADYYGWYESTSGTDQVVAIFKTNRWWLCDSDWNAPPPTYSK